MPAGRSAVVAAVAGWTATGAFLLAIIGMTAELGWIPAPFAGLVPVGLALGAPAGVVCLLADGLARRGGQRADDDGEVS